MRIVFFCPPVSVINGGIKHIFRMAESLIAQGRDAVVFEQNGQRPSWFASTAPVVGQGIFSPSADHFYVLPEDQPHILADFAKRPQPKAVYSQNHFYGALGLANGPLSYKDYGVSGVLCSSRTIFDHCRARHPGVNAYIVPCAVDLARFPSAAGKKNAIAFMPRKRPVEAAYIRDMFRFSYPEYRDWEWLEISNVPEAEVARRLGEAKVFLSLSRLEGFGLTPLEAMASGCIVAGFTGIGGREYASAENGFWVDEDDVDACVPALAKAVRLSDPAEFERADYRKACQETLALYTPQTFDEGVKKAWDALLSNKRS